MWTFVLSINPLLGALVTIASGGVLIGMQLKAQNGARSRIVMIVGILNILMGSWIIGTHLTR